MKVNKDILKWVAIFVGFIVLSVIVLRSEFRNDTASWEEIWDMKWVVLFVTGITTFIFWLRS